MAARTSSQAAGGKTGTAKAMAKRTAAAKAAATHIMAAPKGPRTICHRMIVAAVEKVFRNRTNADAKRSGRDIAGDRHRNLASKSPFDDAYLPLFGTLVFAVFECGLIVGVRSAAPCLTATDTKNRRPYTRTRKGGSC